MQRHRRWLLIALVSTLVVGLWGWQQIAPAQRDEDSAENKATQSKAAESKADEAKSKAETAKGKAKMAGKNKGAGAAKAGAGNKAAAKADDDHPVHAEGAGPTSTGPWLSSGDSYDDFVSVAQQKDGTIYAAYAAYFDGHDQIRVHKQLSGDRWSTRTHMPLVEAQADVWMPQLAVDANDKLWVIWSEQTGRTPAGSGNWDLYARALNDKAWGPLVRLTTDPRPDINHHVCVDADGGIHVVWQAHPDNNGDIMLVRYDGKKWSKPMAVTTGAASDWYPQVAVDQKGTEWIAFDSYRNGDYDVFLTSVKDNQVGDVVPIATSKYYEAHPSIACASDGKVWVSWEQGGWLWGKDQGHWLKVENRNVGSPLGSTRQVKVAVYDGGTLLAAPDPMGEPVPEPKVNKPKVRNLGGSTAMGVLAADAEGRVWLAYRIQRASGVNNQGKNKKHWTENVTYMTDAGWASPKQLELSPGRISVFSRLLPAKDGGLIVGYSADMRTVADWHRPIQDRAFVTVVPKPEDRPGIAKLDAYQAPEPPENATTFDDAREIKDVAAIRGTKRDIGGTSHQIVRGDFHRHTEMSWDVGPGNDGSFLDFYRYMIDVASMDFGALTDHQGGGHYPFHWWLTQKSADLFYLPTRFVPLYGYERSVKFPQGHRNVLHAYRGVPVFPFQIKLDASGTFPGVSAGNVVDNDTKLLYEFLRKTNGICASHTSATDTMGTDWRDNDPFVEPIVEMYQGARNSSEALGAPRVHPIDREPASAAPGGFQQEGLVWNAYGKGYRLGSISSSDHGSTHISYALVYTPKKDRESIIESMRQRQTYGSTDNLIVSFEADGHFMGQEYKTKKPPTLKLSAKGTSPVERIDLIRNARYIYTSSPRKGEVDVSYTDMEPNVGVNYYYFRLLQEDGEVAWASPVWVNFEK